MTDDKVWAGLSDAELEASSNEYERKLGTGEYTDDGFLADIAVRIRQEIGRRVELRGDTR